MKLFLGLLLFAFSFSARADGGRCVDIFQTEIYKDFFANGARKGFKTFDEYAYAVKLRDAEVDYFANAFLPQLGDKLTNAADVAEFLGKLSADVTEGYAPARDVIFQIFHTFYQAQNPQTLQPVVQYYQFLNDNGMIGPNAVKFAKAVHYNYVEAAQKLNERDEEFINEVNQIYESGFF